MKRIAIITLLLITAFSCTDTLDIDIEEGPVRLVVEGRITFNPDEPDGYQSIRLTTTAPYFQNQPVPAASGAQVAVTNTRTNEVFTFSESDRIPGLYETNDMQAAIGEEYRLSIIYEGDEYEAIERLLPVAAIDSLYQVFQEETLFQDEGIKVLLDYSDPEGEENYYHWQVFRNDTLLVTADVGNQFNLISSDEFYDGLQISEFEPSSDFSFVPGDVAVVRQYALNAQSFEYYRNYYEQVVGIAPGLADVVPATLRGNVQNVSNPDRYPLGYFEASAVSEKRMRIE